MTYFLGRDVQVWILTENDSFGINTTSREATKNSSLAAANFANKRGADSLSTAYLYADVTGIDLTLDKVDEQISYYGKRSTLNAEMKKMSSISITRKKDDDTWDVIFNGPTASADATDTNKLDQGARWGVTSESGGSKISNGLLNPKDHHNASDTTVSEYGYRIVLQMRNSGTGTGELGDEFIALPNSCFVEHTVTLNADGITEETATFETHVDPIINYSKVNVVAATATSNM